MQFVLHHTCRLSPWQPTVTALNDFNQAISQGMNKKKPADRTILLQLDLSKAFDMVSHDKLLKDLNQTSLPPEIKRWFNFFMDVNLELISEVQPPPPEM